METYSRELAYAVAYYPFRRERYCSWSSIPALPLLKEKRCVCNSIFRLRLSPSMGSRYPRYAIHFRNDRYAKYYYRDFENEL